MKKSASFSLIVFLGMMTMVGQAVAGAPPSASCGYATVTVSSNVPIPSIAYFGSISYQTTQGVSTFILSCSGGYCSGYAQPPVPCPEAGTVATVSLNFSGGARSSPSTTVTLPATSSAISIQCTYTVTKGQSDRTYSSLVCT